MSDQETFNQSGSAAKNQKGKKSKPVNWIEAPQQSISGQINNDGANKEASGRLEQEVLQFKDSKSNTGVQETQNINKTVKSMSSTVTTAFVENMNSYNKDDLIDKLKSSHKTSNSGQVTSSKYEQGNRAAASTSFKDYHQQFQMNDTYNQRGDNFSSPQGIPPSIGLQSNTSGYQYLSYVTNHEAPVRGGTNSSQNNIQQNVQVSSEIEGEERASKVLLVIVQNPRDEVIQHKIIFNKFISYGNVEQILIFSKKQQWKFFVDMDSLENAAKARKYLDNSTIHIYGKDLRMRVQYSNQQELQLKNGNPGGINYKELNSKFENTQLSYSSPIDNYPSSQQSEAFYQAQRRLLDGNGSSNENARIADSSPVLHMSDADKQAFNPLFEGTNRQLAQLRQENYPNYLSKNSQQGLTSLSAQVAQTTAKNQFLSVNLRESPSFSNEIAPLQDAEKQNKSRNYIFNYELIQSKQADDLSKQLKERQQEGTTQLNYEIQSSQFSFGRAMENSCQDNLNYPHENFPGQNPFQQVPNLTQPLQQQIVATENPVSLKNESLTEQLDDLLKQINNNGKDEEEEDEVKQGDQLTEEEQQSEKDSRDYKVEDDPQIINQEPTQLNQKEQIVSPPAAGDNAPPKGLNKLDQLLSNCESQENSLVVSDNDDEESERVWSDNGIAFDSSSKNAIFSDYQKFTHSENLNSRAYMHRTQPQSDFYQNSMAQEPSSQLAQHPSATGFLPYPNQIKSANILQTMSQYPSTSFNLNQQNGNMAPVYNGHGQQMHYPNQQLLSGQYGGNHHQHRYFSGNISSQTPPGITYSPNQKQQGFLPPQYVSQSPLGQEFNIQQTGQVQLQQSQQTFAGLSPQQFTGQTFGSQNKPGQTLSGQIPTNQVVQENMGMFHGSTYVKQGFLEDSRPSKVIYINHLASPLIQLTHLYNVFSNFGDIVKILFKRPKGTAFIEYTTQEFATRSKDCMDKKVFFESEVRVFYSHFESLISQQEDKQSEIFLGSELTHRFLKDPKMTLNAPSLVIHISNLKQEVCDHEKMHELFHPFGKIEAIHIEKNPPRYMCHIKFSQIKESLMAVAYMHNYETKGRKMFLSFTRKKLDSSVPIKNMVLYSKQTAQI